MGFARFTYYVVAAWLGLVSMAGCMRWDYGGDGDEAFDVRGRGLFVVNEGNFQYGNATLSYYDPADGSVLNEVFVRANGMRLGDVAQSMTMYGGRGWIVVNNSHVVFAIDQCTFRETGRIENLTSPRYIHFTGPDKAYVTQLWDNRIAIVDPRRYAVTGYIEVPEMEAGDGSTERMVAVGGYVYCNCWSYQNRIIRIDTATDRVTGSVTVGMQPNSLVADAQGRLWTLTDGGSGGYDGSPSAGRDVPALWCIDAATMRVLRRFELGSESAPRALTVGGDGSTLYWIDGDVWRMRTDDAALPVAPFIESRGTRYYGLTVDPVEGDVYVADAIDYQQPGMIYRYTAGGEPVGSFYAGVTPGAFAWKND